MKSVMPVVASVPINVFCWFVPTLVAFGGLVLDFVMEQNMQAKQM